MVLNRTWEVLRRRKKVIFLTWVAVAGIVLIGSFLVTPVYQAFSKILILKVKKDAVDVAGQGPSSPVLVPSAIPNAEHTQVLALSRPYYEKMASRLQLRDKNGSLVKAPAPLKTGLISIVKKWIFPGQSINISREAQTDVLWIEARSPDPEQAMMMANALADIIVDENRAQILSECKNARGIIEDQINEENARYKAALLKIRDFKEQSKTVDLEMETKLAAERVAGLLKNKEETVVALAQARARLDFLRQRLSRENPELILASVSRQNPPVERIREKLTDLKLQLAQAMTQMTERHPKVLSLKEQIETAEAELQKEIKISRSSIPELSNLEAQIPDLEARLTGLNAGIEKAISEFNMLPQKAFEQAALDMDLKITPSAHRTLSDSLRQIVMTEANARSAIKIIEPAVKPLSPVYPNKTMNGVVGVLVGLWIGLVLAFIAERLDDSIRTAADVRAIGVMSLLGVIPRFTAGRPPLISTRDPNDPFCEAYRSIRTQIGFIERQCNRCLHSLLITSAGPREGKTTTAANLGISMAREGKNVVVLDMDLRRPGLHTVFGLSGDIGLSDLIQGRACLDKAISPTQVEGLSIVPGGTPFHDPGTLIDSDTMGALIAKFKHIYEVIIVDSAPLLVKNDARILAQHVDGTVVVVESEKTTRKDMLAIREILERACVEPTGFVLNRSSSGNESHIPYKRDTMISHNQTRVAGPVQLEYWDADRRYVMRASSPLGVAKNRVRKRLRSLRMTTSEK
jgi:capsular exopolysaccharide synthesis family protein